MCNVQSGILPIPAIADLQRSRGEGCIYDMLSKRQSERPDCCPDIYSEHLGIARLGRCEEDN